MYVYVYIFSLVVYMNISLYISFFWVHGRGESDTGITRKISEKNF